MNMYLFQSPIVTQWFQIAFIISFVFIYAAIVATLIQKWFNGSNLSGFIAAIMCVIFFTTQIVFMTSYL